MTPTTKFICQASFFLAILSGPAIAAPTDDKESVALPPAAQDSSSQIPIDRLAAPPMNSGSRTVDLLVELQGKQAGLGVQATERAATRADIPPLRSDLPGRLAGTPGPQTSSHTGLFDAGASQQTLAPPLVASPAVQRSADWREGQIHGGSAGSAYASPMRQAPFELDEGWTGRLRVAVGWLRENRSWVIGTSALLLLAVGLASRRRARRR